MTERGEVEAAKQLPISIPGEDSIARQIALARLGLIELECSECGEVWAQPSVLSRISCPWCKVKRLRTGAGEKGEPVPMDDLDDAFTLVEEHICEHEPGYEDAWEAMEVLEKGLEELERRHQLERE